MFSATVDLAEPLQLIEDWTQRILGADGDQASAMLEVRKLWERLGYQPDATQAGGLEDLASVRRITLQIETNVDIARGYGQWMQGQDEAVLDEYLIAELIRASTPEGEPRDWAKRWEQAGGRFWGGRMIARKDDPVWSAISDPQRFPDGLGNPYSPFAFSSGMIERDETRDLAEALGLITPTQRVKAQDRGFNDDLKRKPDVRSASLREAMEASGLGAFDTDGVFYFKPEGWEDDQ